MRETRDEYSRLMSDVEEKRELARQASGGGEVLKGDEVTTPDRCMRKEMVKQDLVETRKDIF